MWPGALRIRRAAPPPSSQQDALDCASAGMALFPQIHWPQGLTIACIFDTTRQPTGAPVWGLAQYGVFALLEPTMHY
jgi:hypothetical protein